MARILAVGVATLDLVFEVERYPAEDEEMRARRLRTSRGGNAANTAVLLAQLGHEVSFAGVLAQSEESAWLVRDFQRHGVDLSACVYRPGKPPTSSIWVTPSGSRTIVHYRDLPEFGREDLARVDLSAFDWIHFEGRNIPELGAMLDDARSRCPAARLSLEAEKSRPGLATVLGRVDLLLTGRAFATARGQQEATAFLRALRAEAPRPLIFCGWGAEGAYALEGADRVLHTPAFPPPRLVDTVGAGDTFNAGVIHGLLAGESVAQTLTAAARLAGRKCGREGLSVN